MMIEQPLGWDDIWSHVELQRKLQTPICLDECIHTEEHARAAIELSACRIINIKLGRVGGYTPRRGASTTSAANAASRCGAAGCWNRASGARTISRCPRWPNFTLPGDVTASQRYWTEDIIEPEVTVTPQGTIHVPRAAGIGYEPRRERIEQLTVRREVLR